MIITLPEKMSKEKVDVLKVRASPCHLNSGLSLLDLAEIGLPTLSVN
jgi:hypothetical protein